MDKFMDLLKESVIFSGIITIGLIGAAVYLWITGQQVPEELYLLLGTVVGFFFGGKAERAVSNTRPLPPLE